MLEFERIELSPPTIDAELCYIRTIQSLGERKAIRRG